MELDWNQQIAEVRELRANRQRLGHGKRPAVIVVDFQKAYTEHDRILPSMAAALESTAILLDKARAANVPVVYLGVVLDSLDERPLSWRARSGLTALCMRGSDWTEMNPIVAMTPGDHLVEKKVASGFYETNLHELLQSLGVDEVILTGTSTSGCVRATALDAHYRDYYVSVVEECVDDFRPLSGEASLWDIQDRYGDVCSLADTLSFFETLDVTESSARPNGDEVLVGPEG